MNAAEIRISHIPFGTSIHELKSELARILHSPPFLTPPALPFNFEVHIFPRPRRVTWQTAALTLPSVDLTEQFLFSYGQPDCRLSVSFGTTRLQFERSRKPARRDAVERARRLPYEHPREAATRELQAIELQASRVNIITIQFGRECRDHVYSVEWEKACTAYLMFDGGRREFRVKAPDIALEDTRIIVIRASQIRMLSASVHRPSGRPAIFFSLDYPPSFETESVLAQLTTSSSPKLPSRQRWSGFDPTHEVIAPYTSISIRLECLSEDDLETFQVFSRIAHLPVSSFSYPLEPRGLFSDKSRERYELWLTRLPWIVAFHIEALLRAWLADMKEVLSLSEPINHILRARPSGYTVERQRGYVAALLREFRSRAKGLYWYGEDQHSSGDGPMTQPSLESSTGLAELFEEVRAQFIYTPHDFFSTGDTSAPFNCLRFTVTPTTMILEGPFPERSNRVMRQYFQNQDCFLRVSFQDENRLQYRFDRDVDGRDFINRRVKHFLLHGIKIAGADFRFLAYSQSALKEHAVWFVKPFRHTDVLHNVHFVDASTIIQSLGRFRQLDFDPQLLYCPARYAARISQAFTATDAAVSMDIGQINFGHDIKSTDKKYIFTDGVGTISPSLAKIIWKYLQSSHRQGQKSKTYPRAFQIRFQGSKGVVSVDHNLTGNTITVRPSMIKFEALQSMNIEIARAFDKPGAYYLNRPLIMLLEGLGVPYESFKKLQDDAVHDAKKCVTSLERSARLLEVHGLGVSFRLTSAMLGLSKLGLGPPNHDVFWRQMMDFAVNHVLRELKHRARIPVPGRDSWTLVGVADVHGYLNPGEVFACIDSQNDAGLLYLQGQVLVSRSPTIDPGDVQVAWAIGKPPFGSPFAKESLRNALVFSTRGSRPLPSCLGGGDLDGDEYNITMRPDLMPKKTYGPASYEPAPKKLVNHESTMADVADFVAEFISSDTLGIIATNWLVTADQKHEEEGILHPDCLKLAQLHSLAVDYPKTGQPVPIEQIPHPPLRMKPDWNAPETLNGRDKSSYYESQTAVGKLFRAIDLPAVQTAERAVRFQKHHMNQDEQLAHTLDQIYCTKVPRENVVGRTVQKHVAGFIKTGEYDDQTIKEIWEKYNLYVSELRTICADFTLSHSRSAMLSEEEVVVGTIVAKCSQRRRRKDQVSQMREQTSTLVSMVKGSITSGDYILPKESLYRAWVAYRLAIMEDNAFGARSFAWIALGGIFDAIKEIEEERSTSYRG